MDKYVVLVYADNELLCERYFDNEEDADEFENSIHTDNGIIHVDYGTVEV